ncbi:MAG: hypothetical protein Sylvanvirus9_10 [Sylvanvirus sp.]|uniref:C2H2-type domain-containing protein n=1 Tax=Sylvanvirus sp. TaxID=2487774 RepID=A0A3G5AHX9_9VIRU|nr:MAG: hypothetical protein Sylvanvirus9_10 [Sylvanvirus sp.]
MDSYTHTISFPPSPLPNPTSPSQHLNEDWSNTTHNNNNPSIHTPPRGSYQDQYRNLENPFTFVVSPTSNHSNTTNQSKRRYSNSNFSLHESTLSKFPKLGSISSIDKNTDIQHLLSKQTYPDSVLSTIYELLHMGTNISGDTNQIPSNTYSCNICRCMYSSSAQVSLCMKTHHQPLHCLLPECCDLFYSEGSRNLHFQQYHCTHEDVTLNPKPMIQCPWCALWCFFGVGEMERHVMTIHSDKFSLNYVKYQCRECPMPSPSFSSASELATHSTIHKVYTISIGSTGSLIGSDLSNSSDSSLCIEYGYKQRLSELELQICLEAATRLKLHGSLPLLSVPLTESVQAVDKTELIESIQSIQPGPLSQSVPVVELVSIEEGEHGKNINVIDRVALDTQNHSPNQSLPVTTVQDIQMDREKQIIDDNDDNKRNHINCNDDKDLGSGDHEEEDENNMSDASDSSSVSSAESDTSGSSKSSSDSTESYVVPDDDDDMNVNDTPMNAKDHDKNSQRQTEMVTQDDNKTGLVVEIHTEDLHVIPNLPSVQSPIEFTMPLSLPHLIIPSSPVHVIPASTRSANEEMSRINFERQKAMSMSQVQTVAKEKKIKDKETGKALNPRFMCIDCGHQWKTVSPHAIAHLNSVRCCDWETRFARDKLLFIKDAHTGKALYERITVIRAQEDAKNPHKKIQLTLLRDEFVKQYGYKI